MIDSKPVEESIHLLTVTIVGVITMLLCCHDKNLFSMGYWLLLRFAHIRVHLVNWLSLPYFE